MQPVPYAGEVPYHTSQLLHHLLHPRRVGVQVAGGRRDVRMPQDILQRRQVAALAQETRGEGVAQGVRRHVPVDPRPPCGGPDQVLHVSRRQPPPGRRV
jgi:hypothetical protein